MRIAVLDVETVPDYPPGASADPEKFPLLPYHRPVVICWLKIDAGHDKATLVVCDAASKPEWEPEALLKLATDLQRAERLITFNGRSFDMPLLQLRALKHGVDWTWWRRGGFRRRYPENSGLYHWDLLDQLTDYGAGTRFTLDALCKLLGLPGKRELDGAGVTEAWAAGRTDEVVTYCVDDVLQTAACGLRMLYTDWSDVWSIVVRDLAETIKSRGLVYGGG